MEGSASGLPKPKKSNTKVIAAVVVIVVVVVGVLVLAMILANQGRNGANNNTDHPQPNIQYVSATYSQAVLSGDVTVNVKVTNQGNAIGPATIQVSITENSGTYSNSQTITLAPSETETVPVVVNTPFGTTVTSSMITIYINGVLV